MKCVTLSDLFSSSDYISLHVPLTKETYHMVNAGVLDTMKKTACLINASRGDVVDESALIDALREGKITGAGLDVLSKEPPGPANPLLSMPNVIVTPHSAFISQEALDQLCVTATTAVCDKLQGKAPANIINPEVLKE
ncbi:Glyoxylate/hydroxypyruvate reductase B [subsurface metagenome]